MKPIENIFGFDCVTCEHNRHCYGGNLGNQFRYCQKSIEKVQNLDKLEQENKQLKDNWNKLKEYCKENTLCYEVGDDENTKLIGSKIHGLNVLDKMQELEQGSDK